ncbi:hypothetical protein ACJMK2_024936 [Sinanodonta woodiana]|uniref:Uncharacterized protein n=1 Tax=Sinanodonta woodiana TaxID=1069815 RepID=A0ABD3XGH5_SINWO
MPPVYVVVCPYTFVKNTQPLKPKIYVPSDNVTVHFDQLDIDEQNILEITFSGYTNKLHVTNVMLCTPMKNETDLNSNYTGRIPSVKMDKGNLSFILLNVSFIDSGNYTVVEHSLEKGKTSIFVPRRTLLGDYNNIMLISLICNSVNISKIQIDMITSTRTILVVMYDVRKGECTESGQHYLYRIQHCVFTGNTFSFTIQELCPAVVYGLINCIAYGWNTG